jgi:hypothetical protein
MLFVVIFAVEECAGACRYMFQSAGNYTGDFGSYVDSVCNSEAALSTISMIQTMQFVAYVSMSSYNGAQRFAKATVGGDDVCIVNVRNQSIAANLTNLVELGPTSSTVITDQNGNPTNINQIAWTGTLDGYLSGDGDCGNWTSSSSGVTGIAANVSLTEPSWSSAYFNTPCDTLGHIVCMSLVVDATTTTTTPAVTMTTSRDTSPTIATVNAPASLPAMLITSAPTPLSVSPTTTVSPTTISAPSRASTAMTSSIAPTKVSSASSVSAVSHQTSNANGVGVSSSMAPPSLGIILGIVAATVVLAIIVVIVVVVCYRRQHRDGSHRLDEWDNEVAQGGERVPGYTSIAPRKKESIYDRAPQSIYDTVCDAVAAQAPIVYSGLPNDVTPYATLTAPAAAVEQ